MAKSVKVFSCPVCDYTSSNQAYKCKKCGSFEEFIEVTQNDSNTPKVGTKTVGKSSGAKTPKKLDGLTSRIERTPTHISELDRVLGGGFVQSEVALLGAPPGSGKSSLTLTVCDAYARQGKTSIYFSGEEVESQIKSRADRFNITSDNISLLYTQSLNEIISVVTENKPDLFVVDSLQTVASEDMTGSIGSISQSKEAAHVLTSLAKELNINAVLINQVTKDGDFAGSTAIQHIVDVSLFLESDKNTPLKFLRAHKNRYGSTEEVGIFQHVENGIIGVSDPSGIFVDTEEPLEGVSYSVTAQGIRQIPVEIQSLVSPTTNNNPKRRFNGIDFKRGEIICPILDKQCVTGLNDYDVYVSTFGGIHVDDPLTDLAIASSLYSSRMGKPMPEMTVFIGEITPVGQVRGVHNIDQKLKEAKRMGFTRAIIPKNAQLIHEHAITIERINSLSDIGSFFQ